MAWFSAGTVSTSTVPVASQLLWDMLTDPTTLAELTPLVKSIEASGSQWLWTLHGIEGLGMKVEAAFTERMEFIDKRRIVFAHDPPPGKNEHAAVDGIYELTPAGDEVTDLKIDLTLSVELPLPRLARHAVEPIMLSAMRRTGQQFAVNLYERFGLDPATAEINEISHR